MVDEAQDFDGGWLASLEGLLYGGKQDVLYVFHDPAQAVFRADQTGELGLTDYPLDFNCRNAQPIHALIEPFAKGGLSSMARRQDGRPVELIAADVDSEAIEALRKVLHRLVETEGVAPGSIAVISGLGLEHSAVWKQRRYGNQVLWNGAVGDDGRLARSRGGRSPGAAEGRHPVRVDPPLQGPGTAGHRAAGDPRDDPERLDRLLYIGASRARQHLVIITPVAVLRRLERPT